MLNLGALVTLRAGLWGIQVIEYKYLLFSSKASDFDAILREIGPFGIWQKKIFGWMCLASMAAGMGVVVYVFTGF